MVETLKAFANRIALRAESAWADANPHMDGGQDMTHWKVTLRARIDGKARRMTVPFSMGMAHHGEPDPIDVLDCLVSDASGAYQDFETWASDLGFDPDSRKAERTYRTVVRQTKRLRAFLGPEYDRAMECERL